MAIKTRSILFSDEVKIYELLETVRTFSTCKDKQVAACAVDIEGNIYSVAYNIPSDHCDECKSLEHPHKCAEHAETRLKLVTGLSVYLTTFPCAACQMYLWSAGVTNVFVFGTQHKPDTGLLEITLLPDLVGLLTSFNGPTKQKTVASGELGELITALADSERKDIRESNVLEEVIDVQLQLHCLNRIKMEPLSSGERFIKYAKLIQKFQTLVDAKDE